MKLLDLAKDVLRTGSEGQGLSTEEKALLPPLSALAALALRAGVVLSLDEFATLSRVERLAFARAGDAIREDTAQRSGLAAQGAAGLAMSVNDDGATYEAYRANELHERAVRDHHGR